jgi:hypothetical protein
MAGGCLVMIIAHTTKRAVSSNFNSVSHTLSEEVYLHVYETVRGAYLGGSGTLPAILQSAQAASRV